MSFLEALRKQKVAEKESAAREVEAESERALALQQEQERLREQRRLQQEREQQDEARMRALREQALRASIAPEMLRQLGEIIGRKVVSEGDTDYLPLTDEPESQEFVGGSREHHGAFYTDSDHYIYYYKAIVISGEDDGSISIGSEILGQDKARDAQAVDSAFEEAYRRPELHGVHVIQENTQENSNW